MNITGNKDRSRFYTVVLLIAAALGLNGCASLGEGIARAALKGNDEKKEDTRQCSIRGPAFRGIVGDMERQGSVQGSSGPRARKLKVLMVHGIGTHLPGYSTMLAENLARALRLDVVANQTKEILPETPRLFPGEKLGIVRVNRFTNKGGTREMLFYELTWSGITEPDKQLIAYDDSGEYSFRRAGLNNTMKTFVNNYFPDPLIYYGDAHERIQSAVLQTFCWALSGDWEDLQERTASVCDPSKLPLDRLVGDDYVFISHSLGSRIVTDALQRIAGLPMDEKVRMTLPGKRWLAALRDKEFKVFMLANQLPLLQLGRAAPEIAGQFDEYCTATGAKRDQRVFKRLNVVAFSDPNDILSWAVEPDYVEKNVDSRVCPTMVNVIINVAEVKDIFGITQVANPGEAHSGYDRDERVLGLIANGIGNERVHPLVKQRCTWVETR
ncbi:MAG: hypothetical protein ACREV4_09635 [Gammaproteobacteria bacterium]